MLEPNEAEEAHMDRRGLLPDKPKDDCWWKTWRSREVEWSDLKDGWRFGKAQWVEDKAAGISGKSKEERKLLGTECPDAGVQRTVVRIVKAA